MSGLGAGRLLALVERIFVVYGVVLVSGAVSGPLGGKWADSALDKGPTPLHSLLLLSVYGLSCTLLICRPSRLIERLKQNLPLATLPILAAASAAWSVAPSMTVGRTGLLCGSFGFGLYLAVRFESKTSIRLLAVGMLAAAAIAILLVALVPDSAVMTGVHAGAWRGGFGQKNGLGGRMVVGVIACLAAMRTGRRWVTPMLIGATVCLALLLLSRSATAMVVGLGAVSVLAVGRRVSGLGTLVLVPAVLLVVGATVSGIYAIATNWIEVLSLLGRDPTLTGRTVLWAMASSSIVARPLTGFGYGAFWSQSAGTGANVRALAGWDATQAHNGYLDMALDFGVVGAIIFLLGIALASHHAWREAQVAQDGAFRLACVATLLALNLTESVFQGSGTIFLPLMVYAAFASLSTSTRGQLRRPTAKETKS